LMFAQPGGGAGGIVPNVKVLSNADFLKKIGSDTKSSRRTLPSRANGTDESQDIIYETPEGDAEVYLRSGQCYVTADGEQYSQNKQVGLVTVVTAPDKKTVYIKD